MDPSILFNAEETTSEYSRQFGQIHPGAIPVTPIVWPIQRSSQTKIQQNKNSAKPTSLSTLATTGPGQSPVAPRTTPPTVSKVRVVLRPAVNGMKQVLIQFTHPSENPYFSGARVYLKKAGTQPTIVASGSKSPLTFNAPVNHAPHSIYVTSVSNLGETDISTSPSHPVRLY
jgi:hypothetical protein